MSSGINPPDLVRRAAEHLTGGVRLSLPERLAALGQQDQYPEPEQPRPTPPRAAREMAASRRITISPATLAANGIFLPSSDPAFVLTVEEYRSIRRHIMANITRRAAGKGEPSNRTILITSAKPGDGKTFTAINLALSLALGRERSVLLVDGDAHRRSMLDYLGIKAELGWVDLLTRTDLSLSDVVLSTNFPNLSILPSGKATGDLLELIGSRKMKELIEELNGRDPEALIVIDSLPCLVSNEPAVLAEIAGQVVFVVAANETSREEVQTSLSYLTACPIISLVLNKGEPLMSEQFSRYGYQYRYDQA